MHELAPGWQAVQYAGQGHGTTLQVPLYSPTGRALASSAQHATGSARAGIRDRGEAGSRQCGECAGPGQDGSVHTMRKVGHSMSNHWWPGACRAAPQLVLRQWTKLQRRSPCMMCLPCSCNNHCSIVRQLMHCKCGAAFCTPL